MVLKKSFKINEDITYHLQTNFQFAQELCDFSSCNAMASTGMNEMCAKKSGMVRTCSWSLPLRKLLKTPHSDVPHWTCSNVDKSNSHKKGKTNIPLCRILVLKSHIPLRNYKAILTSLNLKPHIPVVL
jgi:hypothetical protein